MAIRDRQVYHCLITVVVKNTNHCFPFWQGGCHRQTGSPLFFCLKGGCQKHLLLFSLLTKVPVKESHLLSFSCLTRWLPESYLELFSCLTRWLSESPIYNCFPASQGDCQRVLFITVFMPHKLSETVPSIIVFLPHKVAVRQSHFSVFSCLTRWLSDSPVY